MLQLHLWLPDNLFVEAATISSVLGCHNNNDVDVDDDQDDNDDDDGS